MKNLVKLVCCLFFLTSFQTVAAKGDTDIEKLRKLFIEQAISPGVNSEKVDVLLSSIQPDGTWPGIDYTDVSRTGFQHSRHLDNLVVLSRAYKKKDSPFKGKRNVKQAFDQALAYWMEHDFICENWWNNEIGTPSAFITMLLVMDESLDKAQVEKMLPIAQRANLNAWGARPSGDRIKIAGLQAKTALFCRDAEQLGEVLKVLEGEIKFSTEKERGIQYDYSFHHREDRVNNTLSYGLGYVDAFAEWAANVADTRFRFSDHAMHLAVDYYLDGVCKQMVYGREADTGIRNRDITRPDRKGYFGIVTPERFLKASDYRKAELENIIKARKGEPFVSESFAKFFWQTEHFVFQRPDFYTSVRMYSTRNRNMEEPYNGEGLTNHFRADGTNYLSLTGEEYFNLAPVYDWMRIPGATTLILDKMPSEKEIQKDGLTDFVGGVTDGLYGAVAFDFISPHYSLKAKKGWFFFDKEYICLGAGITSNTDRAVVTTLNQCHLKGDVTVSAGNGTDVLNKGEHHWSGIEWISHDNVGYVFSEPQKISLLNAEASGSWYSINHQTSSSKELIKEDVFKLWVEHGERPTDATYSYVVLPAADQEQILAYVKQPTIRILSNTVALQAVEHMEKGCVYAICYQGGTLSLGARRGMIEMDSSGMLMAHYDRTGKLINLAVSDPSRHLAKLHLSIQGKLQSTSDSVSCSYDVSTDRTNLAITLPQGGYAGSSVQIFFN